VAHGTRARPDRLGLCLRRRLGQGSRTRPVAVRGRDRPRGAARGRGGVPGLHGRERRLGGRARLGERAASPGLAPYGTKTPCVSKSVLSPVVEAMPSGPPSNTWTWPSSQFERRCSRTVPGTRVSALVAIEQLEPIVAS